jgi:hypothetical protein
VNVPDSEKAIYRGEESAAPEIPSWFEARVTAVFGTTLSGKPKGRVVWGGDARGFPWPDNQLKYISPLDPTVGWACFVLEQFVSPEFFGMEDVWERNRWTWDGEGKRVELMAPYPRGGDYVLVQPLVTPDGEAFPLTEGVAEYISWLVKTNHETPHNGYTQQQFIRERIEKIQKAKAERRKEADEHLKVVADEAATRADRANLGMTREYSLPSERPAPFAALRAKAAQFLSKEKA